MSAPDRCETAFDDLRTGRWIRRGRPNRHVCRMPRTWFNRARVGDIWECYCLQRWEWTWVDTLAPFTDRTKAWVAIQPEAKT